MLSPLNVLVLIRFALKKKRKEIRINIMKNLRMTKRRTTI